MILGRARDTGAPRARVLLVEDNAALLQNLYDYFEDHGYELDSARDGLAGLTLASSGAYDLIVLDLSLPRLDGLELCRRLRADHGRRTPILMLTARDAVEQRVAGLRAGADDYLVKPFALAELEARIEALLRRSELERVLWPDLPPDSDALRTHIHGLRQAVDRPFSSPLIETVRGIGYRLAVPGGD